MKRLILTSYGLTSIVGKKLIQNELAKDGDLSDKRIFLFHEPYYSIERTLVNICLNMGFKEENIILSGQQKSNEDLLTVDYVYITEGNTFEIMTLLREHGLVEVLQKAVENGATYIGASAGAMIAGSSIEEALSFDRNFVCLDDFTGLELWSDSVIIPHYTQKELKRYVRNTPGMKDRYKHIYSIPNSGILVLEE